MDLDAGRHRSLFAKVALASNRYAMALRSGPVRRRLGVNLAFESAIRHRRPRPFRNKIPFARGGDIRICQVSPDREKTNKKVI